MADHLAGVVDEVGYLGIDGRARGDELALFVLAAFLSLVLRGGVAATVVILKGIEKASS